MTARIPHFLIVGLLLLGAALHASRQAPSGSAAASLYYLYGSGSQTGGKNIALRIELTEPAPDGGAVVALVASNGAVNVPASTAIAAGQRETTITVSTDPVTTDRRVTISASYLGVSKSRNVLIKAPVLTSLGLQSVIRHGGEGKVIARISGPAPAGGIMVDTSTDPTGFLLLDAQIMIPAGQTRVSLKAPATLLSSSGASLPDQPVVVTISRGAASFTRSTVIRDFGGTPEPSPTITPSPSPSPSPTPTEISGPPTSLFFVYDVTSVLSGESFLVRACLDSSAVEPSLAQFGYDVTPGRQVVNTGSVSPGSYTFQPGERCIDLTYTFAVNATAMVVPTAIFGIGLNNSFAGATEVTIVSTAPTPGPSETAVVGPSSISFVLGASQVDSGTPYNVDICFDVPALVETSIWVGYSWSVIGFDPEEDIVNPVEDVSIVGDVSFAPGEQCHTFVFTVVLDWQAAFDGIGFVAITPHAGFGDDQLGTRATASTSVKVPPPPDDLGSAIGNHQPVAFHISRLT